MGVRTAFATSQSRWEAPPLPTPKAQAALLKASRADPFQDFPSPNPSRRITIHLILTERIHTKAGLFAKEGWRLSVKRVEPDHLGHGFPPGFSDRGL